MAVPLSSLKQRSAGDKVYGQVAKKMSDFQGFSLKKFFRTWYSGVPNVLLSWLKKKTGYWCENCGYPLVYGWKIILAYMLQTKSQAKKPYLTCFDQKGLHIAYISRENNTRSRVLPKSSKLASLWWAGRSKCQLGHVTKCAQMFLYMGDPIGKQNRPQMREKPWNRHAQFASLTAVQSW